jgi:hypothetical protein
MPALRFLGEREGALLDQAYERVFRPSFDTAELPGIDLVRPLPVRLVLVALDGGDVVAGAVYDTVPGSDIGLLSYMATQPGDRSRGLGAAVLGALRERWAADAVPLVVAEVRDPRVWPRSESERPADRLRFYSRNGCHLVPVPWVQPAIDGGARERGMLLLAVHGAERGARIEAPALADWAARYYVDSEGREPDDAEYRALIDAFSSRDLVVLRIDEYESVPLL